MAGRACRPASCDIQSAGGDQPRYGCEIEVETVAVGKCRQLPGIRVRTAEQRQAEAAALPVELVRDAGRIQVAPGTLTCGAAGAADSDRIDAATAGLSLM
ncbi:MAG TPA: peptidyl-tRNA hydrolase [Streptosporangiaceae bacterium]|nr:peptidyl-tRNA hydrolase [Streptosporangiaceae bacterium]